MRRLPPGAALQIPLSQAQGLGLRRVDFQRMLFLPAPQHVRLPAYAPDVLYMPVLRNASVRCAIAHRSSATALVVPLAAPEPSPPRRWLACGPCHQEPCIRCWGSLGLLFPGGGCPFEHTSRAYKPLDWSQLAPARLHREIAARRSQNMPPLVSVGPLPLPAHRGLACGKPLRRERQLRIQLLLDSAISRMTPRM